MSRDLQPDSTPDFDQLPSRRGDSRYSPYDPKDNPDTVQQQQSPFQAIPTSTQYLTRYAVQTRCGD
jgi:hypothetical protein